MARASKTVTRVRRWRRRLLGATLGLVLLVGVAVLVLHTSWGKDRVRQRVEAALGKRVRGTVSIASLDYDFPFGDLRVAGIEIRDTSEQPAIAVDSLDVSVGLWETLTDKLVIDSLHLRGVRLQSYIAEDGHNSLRDLFIKRKGGAKAFAVRSVRIEKLQWDVRKADGDRITLSDGALQARLERGEFTEVFLDTFEATFVATRGEHVSVEGRVRQNGAVLKTNPQRTILSLQPLSTTLRIKRDGQPEVESELRVASGELSLTRTSLVASIEQAVLGPLTIGEAHATLGFDRGEPSGQQEVQLNQIALDTKIVAALLRRDVPVGNATGQASISGPLEDLVVKGTLETAEGQIEILGHVDVTGPDAPAYTLSATTDIAIGAWPVLENNSLRIDSLLPTALRLELSGVGLPSNGGPMQMQLLGLQTIDGVESETVRLEAHREGHSLQVDSLKLNLLGAEVLVAGSMNTSTDARDVSATLSIIGNAKQALAQLEALGLRVSPPLHLPSQLSLQAAIRGDFNERVVVQVLPSETAIAGGRVRLQGEAVFEAREEGLVLVEADGTMSLRALQIARLARIARRRVPVRGRLDGRFALRQRGEARSISHNLRARLPDNDLEVRTEGRLAQGTWTGRISAHAGDDQKELAWLEGTLPIVLRNGIRLRRRGKLDVRAHLPVATLSEHAHRLTEPWRKRLAMRLSEAELQLTLALQGSARQPRGHLALQTTLTPSTASGAPIDIDLGVEITGQDDGTIVFAPAGTLVHSQLPGPLLTLGGELRAEIDRLRPARSKLRFDLHADVSKRPVASLAALAPRLEGMLGDVSGQLTLRGSREAPQLEGHVAVGTGNPVRLDIAATPEGKTVALRVQSHADDLALSDLWPSSVPRLTEAPLLLNSDLGADAVIDLSGAPRVASLDLHGATTLKGALVPIPDSSRQWRNLQLVVEGVGQQVRAQLRAEESDAQVERRTLALHADATLEPSAQTLVREAHVRVETEQWLLFGGVLGRPDGPRATLDADIDIVANLVGPLPVVDVTARKLAYSEPDREVFTHGFTDIAPKGDVVFTGDPARPPGTVGPIINKTRASAEVEAGKPRARIRVHLPEPVTIAKGPLKLVVRGEVEQLVAPGAGPTGTLEIDSGHLTFFGQDFPFVDSKIALDGGPPKVDIFFADDVAPDILRRVSRESAGSRVQIHLRPVGGGPLVSFSGAGNDSMIESLSLLHTGHGYWLSQPDAPASTTVRAPQGMHPLMIAFIKANIPKLDLLDRFAVWSSPYDAHTSYGQLRYLDATRRLGDGTSQLRLVSRPQQIGRSSSEAHLDKLFVDSESMSLGAGLRAGSRLGGGVGVFFEWTSSD